MLNFVILEKNLGLISPPHFVYDFSKKMFFMLYSINWENFIVLLPLLFGILENMCIAIVCFLGCEVIHFGIKIKPCFYMAEKSRQKLKYLENEKSF